MVDLVGMRALQAVATTGSLVRAAEELGYTASAVSQQIKRLERTVGTPLLATAGRGVVLNTAGQAMAALAPEAFRAVERCTEAARSVADGQPNGVLRVAAFSTAIRGLIAPVLPVLSARHPALGTRIVEQDPEQAVRSVEGGAVDVAVVHDADGLPVPVSSALVRQHLHTDMGDVVMHRGHPLAPLTDGITPADLVEHPWVVSPVGTVCHRWFRRLLADIPVEPDVRHLVDDFSSQLALVGSGDVVALVPRLARPPLPDGVVSRSLDRPPTRTIHAVWRRSADANPAIRALLAQLTDDGAPRHHECGARSADRGARPGRLPSSAR